MKEPKSLSAFHLHGIFGEDFLTNGTVQVFQHVNGTEKMLFLLKIPF